MGVAGAGKTLAGRALADRLRWPFFDADDFHPPANIAKMRSGAALSDVDREQWLADLHAQLSRVQKEGSDAVLACSALRSRFRARLRAGIANVHYVYLRADAALVAARLRARTGHFMSADLLDSQFEALEEPDDALVLDASATPDALVAQIRLAFNV